MDIRILDSWLRDFLITKAAPSEIAKYLSACGPSVERIEKIENDYIYDIEITTNRIDTVGVYGIAREASAILPRFGIKSNLKPAKHSSKDYLFSKDVSYLDVNVDPKLCSRFTAVLIKNVKITDSPKFIKERLESSGIRAINNVIDISNYVMLELGQPVHTFDYDKIAGAKMTLRESRKGEVIETLDGKKFTLPGGDIVIEDGEGNLIDLCGVMGGEASAIDKDTENVLLFVQTYSANRIRKTSMALAQRTMAATIFEKGTDPELVEPAMLSAIDLFNKHTKGITEKNILNICPLPYKVAKISLDFEFIKDRLGVEISKNEITSYLRSLEFGTTWKKDILTVEVPSFRSSDVTIAEDVLEEIARIYGYHNLPSTIMEGQIPVRPIDSKFDFEMEIKNVLAGFGGVEAYTLSLVSKKEVDEKALQLANPLGSETEYLRTSLMSSLLTAAKTNLGTSDNFHIFEMANIYLHQANDLPNEKLMLSGISANYTYRQAKGIVEGLLGRLHINTAFESSDSKGFEASKCASISCQKVDLGKIGVLENSDFIYYELDVAKLEELSKITVGYREIPKYPAQVEDLTFDLPEKTRVGDILHSIQNTKYVSNIELTDIFNNSYTFRVWYQSEDKTLENDEVEKIRKGIISEVKVKFGAAVRD
jgi:phenylalanyl-tRNA synthetase beta chain